MAGYNAGTVFVQVVPSFSGFQKKISRAFQNLDQKMNIDVDTSQFNRKMEQATKVKPVKVGVTPDLDRAALAKVQGALDSIRDAEVNVDVNDAQAKAEIAEIKTRLETLRDKIIRAEVNGQQAKTEMAAIASQADRLAAKTPNVKVAADASRASAELNRVDQEANRIDGRRATLSIIADVSQAITAIASVVTAINSLSGKTVNINVDTSSAMANVARLAARISALGGLAGTIGGLGGAIGALGPVGAIAAGGLLSAVTASKGVGAAVKAMGDAQTNAASTGAAAAKKQVQSARAIEDAQRGVAKAQAGVASAQRQADQANITAANQVRNARQALANAQEQAARRVAQAVQAAQRAEQAVAQAQREVTRAQERLTQARKDATKAIRDMRLELSGAALSEKRSMLSLEQARAALDKGMSEGVSGLELRDLQLAVEEAQQGLEESQQSYGDLQEKAAEYARTGVEGTEQVKSAQEGVVSATERVAQAQQSAADAQKAIGEAQRDGAQQVAQAQQALADAQRNQANTAVQGQESVANAMSAVEDAQRNLAQAMQDAGDDGAGAVDKVKQAFDNLSPAAADFARYLFSLKPLFDQLKATAADNFFPPIKAGIQALVTQFDAFKNVVGLFAKAMGDALGYVLTQLASPFWVNFFTTLAKASGPIMMQLAQVFMQLAQAVGNLVLAFLPLSPMALGLVPIIASLVNAWTPFLVQMSATLIPVLGIVLQALTPLGPVLAALAPIVGALAVAMAQILGAALQALAPLLVALTPLFQLFAQQLAVSMVTAIQSLMPLLLAVANWMGQNPGLVLTMIGVFTGFLAILKPIGFVLGLLLNPLVLLRAGLALFGVSLSTVLAPLGVFGARLAAFLGGGLLSQAGAILSLVGRGIMFLGRSILGALGPIGWVIIALTTMYSSSESFRNAINGLLGVLGGALMGVLNALKPVLDAVMGVFSMLAQVLGGVLTSVANALAPVITMLAGVLTQLVNALLPPLMSIFSAIAPIITMVGQIFVALVNALMPLVNIILNLLIQQFSMFMPVIQALLPIIGFLANILATVLVFYIQNIVLPVLGFFVAAIQKVGEFFGWLGGIVASAFGGTGSLISSIWNSVIKPVFDWFVGFLNRLGMLWNILYANFIGPMMRAIGSVIQSVYNAVIAPVFAAFGWVIDRLRAAFGVVMDWLGARWNDFARGMGIIYDNTLRPVFDWFGRRIDEVKAAFGIMTDAIGQAWDRVVGAIKRVWDNTLGPIFDAVGRGLGAIGDAASWLFGGNGNTATGQIVQHYQPRAKGGMIESFATGGPVRGFAKGGSTRIPASDTVPAMLTPGEFVMTKSATQNASPNLMYQLMAALERDPRLAGLLAQVLGTRRSGSASAGQTSSAMGFASGGSVPTASKSSTGGKPGASAGTGPDPKATAESTAQVDSLNDSMLTLGDTVTNAVTPVMTELNQFLPVVGTTFDTLNATATTAFTGVKDNVQRNSDLMQGRQNALNVGMTGSWNGMAGYITGRQNQMTNDVSNSHNAMANNVTGRQGALNNYSNASWANIAANVGGSVANQIGSQNNLMTGMARTRDAAGLTSGWMRDRYGEMQGFAANPIRAIIQGPFNAGIIAAWNSLNAQFALNKPVGGVPVNFATGGRVFGPGTMTSDSIPANLSRGEFVVKASAAQGNYGFLNAFNNGDVPGYAEGGPVGFDFTGGAFNNTYKMIDDLARNPGLPFGQGTGVARQGADRVRAEANKKIEAMAGALGPLGAGAPFYVAQIANAARVAGVGRDGAIIGVATAIVESALKMYANRSVPASLNFPHDAVGSDHDSVGLFQQRQAGWGTLAQRMNAFGSAMLFFNRLKGFNWRGMQPGAAAQRVQVSAFPGRYQTRMGQAAGLVGQFGGVFDNGGFLQPGTQQVYNGTRKPEAVLTNPQWRVAESAILNNTRNGGDTNVNIYPREMQSEESIGYAAARRLAWEGRTQ